MRRRRRTLRVARVGAVALFEAKSKKRKLRWGANSS